VRAPPVMIQAAKDMLKDFKKSRPISFRTTSSNVARASSPWHFRKTQHGLEARANEQTQCPEL